LSYVAATGDRESLRADRALRSEARALRRRYFKEHPLGARHDDDPAYSADAVNRKWTFGVAAGALLVAGTFAAGALGLNSDAPPADENAAAPEHAPTAPGHGSGGPDSHGDIGTPAVAAPPHGDQDTSRPGDRGTAGADAASGQRPDGGAAQARPAPAKPAPAPAPEPSPAPAPRPGPVERVVTPVTDTVGDVARPVTETVGGLVKPVTGTLSGGGEQPAMTMINPLSDLLGS
jgi:hypothetical protein